MKSETTADLIFDSWKTALINKDRSWNSVYNNFYELFYAMRAASVGFDEAREFIKPAGKAHEPNKSAISMTWKRMSKTQGMSKEEFIDHWLEGIHNQAKKAFFDLFPLNEKLLTEGQIKSQEDLEAPDELVVEPVQDKNLDLERIKAMGRFANQKKK